MFAGAEFTAGTDAGTDFMTPEKVKCAAGKIYFRDAIQLSDERQLDFIKPDSVIAPMPGIGKNKTNVFGD
ncbi:hypothetical protein [Burkholderia sp. 3C]